MKLTDAEWTVMNALWEKSPANARDVLEHCAAQTSWAYTTVKTILSRLVEKGALKVRMRANTSIYQPLVSREVARHSAVSSLLERAFDGAFGPMVHFLVQDKKLNKKERQELLRLLREEGEGA